MSAGGHGAGATQLIPLLEETQPNPVLTAPHPTERTGPLLPPMRQAVGAYDDPADGPAGPGHYEDADAPDSAETADPRRGTADPVRHAYYPGHRMNLGVVLLPMRVLLGFISIYSGMGKLSDPVFFDGGERGSMVKWLTSLHPWAVAEPLRDFALSHPVGAGLTVAFLQVIVGVLTVLGLWQRVAAAFGALLSAALLLAASWRSVPVYDAPDIILLAAWSPLIIAGAPGLLPRRLSGEAWRTLGPPLGDLGPAPPRPAARHRHRDGRRRPHAARRLHPRRRGPLHRGRHRPRPQRQPHQPPPRHAAARGVHRRARGDPRTGTAGEAAAHQLRRGEHPHRLTRPAPARRPRPAAARAPARTAPSPARPRAPTRHPRSSSPPRRSPRPPPALSPTSGSTGGDGSSGGSTGGGEPEPTGGATSSGGEGSTSGGGGRNPIGGLLG